MDTQVLTAHVPQTLAALVDAASARLERPRAWIIKQALSNWLDQEEARRQLTLEGLTAVDRGEITAHDAVLAWAKSL